MNTCKSGYLNFTKIRQYRTPLVYSVWLWGIVRLYSTNKMHGNIVQLIKKENVVSSVMQYLHANLSVWFYGVYGVKRYTGIMS